MDRRQFNRTVLGSAIAALVPGACTRAQNNSSAPRRPNFLIIMGDDLTWNELPLFGGQNVKTPNIDRLASQGMTFNQAYMSMAMCLPCRTEMHTGQYPMRNGCCWNHSAARPGTRSTVHYLGELGYRSGLTGKIHIMPQRAFPFEIIEGVTHNCVHPNPTFDLAETREFINRDPDQPFCMVMALTESHVPWTMGNPENFPPDQQTLPPNFADTEATRRDYSKYLAEIELFDDEVGQILKLLDESGQAENTFVLLTSEQGGQWPGCKWTNWQQGIHTAMIVRWPSRVPAGRRTDALVQYADILPTLLDAAGAKVDPENFDGSSFLPVLQGQTQKHRQYAYHMHNNYPEGPPYPVRSVTDGTFQYIRNLCPERVYIEKHMMGPRHEQEYWPSWVWASTEDDHAYAMVERFQNRPAEELYQILDDPFELKNLADDHKYANIKATLSAELDRWMTQQGDPGAELDSREAHQANLEAAKRWQQE